MRGQTTRPRFRYWSPRRRTATLEEISELFGLLADVEAMAWDAVEGFALEGRDVDQVAEMLGWSKATVYRRMEQRRREVANLRGTAGVVPEDVAGVDERSQVRDLARRRAVATMRTLVDRDSQTCDSASTPNDGRS